MRWQRVAAPKLYRAPRVAGWEHRWREADAVEHAEAPPGRARRAGLVVVGLAALLAALLATIFPFSPGYSFEDTAASVAASVVVATVAVGVIPLAAAVSGWRVRGAWVLARLVLFAAALLSAGAATIHLAVLKMHFDEYTLFGLFFVATGTAQLAWAVCWICKGGPGRPATCSVSSRTRSISSMRSAASVALSSASVAMDRPGFRRGARGITFDMG